MKPIRWDLPLVATRCTTTAQKETFIRNFVRFMEDGFEERRFTMPVYRNLSNCFGHMAHYDKDGFYEYWFGTRERRQSFLVHCIEHPTVGDSVSTFSDVERILQHWIRDNFGIGCQPTFSYREPRALLGGRIR